MPAQLVAAGHETQDSCQYRWDNRRHKNQRYHVLQYTMAGVGQLRWQRSPTTSGPTQFNLGPGDLFIASPDTDFRYSCNGHDSWEFSWLILQGPAVDQAVARLIEVCGSPVIGQGKADPLAKVMDHLLALQEGGQYIDTWGLSVLAWEIVSVILRLGDRTDNQATDQTSHIARRWVTQNPGKATAAGLAAHFGYNPKYFADYFFRHTGQTPGSFIRQQKLSMARILLMTTRKRISEISNDLGFCEDNHFSRAFRQAYGVSPLEFRARNAGALIVDEVVVV